MASTKFSRKEFEKHIKITKEIEDKISMLGTHLESINSEEVELEVLPNRPDLFSLKGFIRSFSSFIGKSKRKDYKIKKSNYKIVVEKSVEKVRPYCMAAVIKNVKLDNEKIKDIMQWQEKIHATIGRNRKRIALGYYILDKIKWPVVYKAESPDKIIFEPLEMPEKMNALQILQKHPTGREYAKQLEGMEAFPVYFDSSNQVLSMPPIINSHSLGKIDATTSNLLIECSGTDLDILKKVTSMAIVDLIDLGGEAYSVQVIYGNRKESVSLEPEKIKINIDDCNKLLGLNLKEVEISRLVQKMGHLYKKNVVEVPCYRTDILHPVDIYEDIAIAYGYENFNPEIPKIATTGETNSAESFKKKVSEIISGLGMLECSSLHLITKEDAKKLAMKGIEVQDSKTDYKILRDNMLISSLKTFSDNVDSEYPQKIFEIGKIFKLDDTEETGIKEKDNLIISLAPGNFTEIKQVLEYLEKMIEIKLDLEESSSQEYITGRTATILKSGRKIGIIGEIKPEVLKTWRIKMPLACLELDVTELMN